MPQEKTEGKQRKHAPQELITNPYSVKSTILAPSVVGYRIHLGQELLKIEDYDQRVAYTQENNLDAGDRTDYMMVAQYFGPDTIYNNWTVRRTPWKLLRMLSQHILDDELRHQVASLLFHWVSLFWQDPRPPISENSLFPNVVTILAALNTKNRRTIEVMYAKYLAETGSTVADKTLLDVPTPALIFPAPPKKQEEVVISGPEQVEIVFAEPTHTTQPLIAEAVPAEKHSNGARPIHVPDLDNLQSYITQRVSDHVAAQKQEIQQERIEAWREVAEETFTAIESGVRVTVERIVKEILSVQLGNIERDIKALIRSTYSEDSLHIGVLEARVERLETDLAVARDKNETLFAEKEQYKQRLLEISDALNLASEIAWPTTETKE